MLNLLDTTQLAETLHISVRSLRNRLSLNPSSLPAAIRVPGGRSVLFNSGDVEAFIVKHTQTRPARGRPTKRQQLDKKNKLTDFENREELESRGQTRLIK